jgi:hypothetical protein
VLVYHDLATVKHKSLDCFVFIYTDCFLYQGREKPLPAPAIAFQTPPIAERPHFDRFMRLIIQLVENPTNGKHLPLNLHASKPKKVTISKKKKVSRQPHT